jgi:hypothetical protein
MTSNEYSGINETARPQLVFLVGPPRSGTTWLQKLLGSHPDIGTAQESHLFNHFLGSMLKSWDHLLHFKDGRGGIGVPAYQTEAAFISMLNEQVHQVLSGADEYRKGSVFLEKTPDHIRHMKDILRVVPDARIILMVRRPADVIESMLSAGEGWGKQWAPGSIFQAIRLFRYFSKQAESDLRDLDTTRVFCVEYERLRESTADVLQAILGFLELPCDSAALENLLNEEFTLRRYGEFAKLGGHIVQEPEGFARSRKGNLSWWERLLVRLTLGNKTLTQNDEILTGSGTT